MEKEEIRRAAEEELQWLKYYALAESRQAFDPTKSPYDQLGSIGYTKRVIPLDRRCAFLRLTAKTALVDTPIEEMIAANGPRDPDNNVLSALEVYMLKYPEEHDWVVKSLQ